MMESQNGDIEGDDDVAHGEIGEIVAAGLGTFFELH